MTTPAAKKSGTQYFQLSRPWAAQMGQPTTAHYTAQASPGRVSCPYPSDTFSSVAFFIAIPVEFMPRVFYLIVQGDHAVTGGMGLA